MSEGDGQDLADLRVWQARLEKAQDSQYSDLKASADKWATSIGVLVGAIGSISIIVVPKALTAFSSDTARDWAFGVAIAAGLSGLVALASAMWVSLGWPEVYPAMDPAAFRTQTINKTASGVTWLRRSRWATLLALIFLVAASVISAADTLAVPPSPVDILVVHKDGTATCGPLTATYQDVAQTTVVAHC